MIKILAGKYKNRKLKYFNFSNIRPTQARIKKSMFDSLMNIENVYSIKGNHEEMLFASLKDLKVREDIKKKYGLGIDYACEKLSDTSLSFLEGLESSMDLILDGKSIGMFHGSPSSINQYIYPDANQETFFNITNNKLNVVLFGHTHHQFVHN